MFHNLTVESNEAVASIRGFSGFLDPGPVGLLYFGKKTMLINSIYKALDANINQADSPFDSVNFLLMAS